MSQSNTQLYIPSNLAKIQFLQTAVKTNTASTTSPTSLFGTGVGSTVLPVLAVGDIVRMELKGRLTAPAPAAAGVTVSFNVSFDGFTMMATAVSLPVGSNITPFQIYIDMIPTSTTNVSVYGQFTYTDPNNPFAGTDFNFYPINTGLSVADLINPVITATSAFSATDATAKVENISTIIQIFRVY